MNRNVVSARGDNGSIGATSNPTATAASGVNALHLLHIGSKLASWTHADAHISLPAPLHHGPVHLLHGARENADSPHISTRLLDDTLVLLTYGVNYLNIRGSRDALLEQVGEHRAQRAIDKANLHTHALRIQATWRCQRFATYRLVPLEFANSNPLLVEVQERMAKEKGSSTRGDLTTAEIEVNLEELQLQINRYAEELRLRVEARKRAAEQQRLRLEREHREQEDLHKKQYYQKKRRHHNNRPSFSRNRAHGT
uniref:Uncharacterized protein n=1 Tax=Globisporangium ultimum (strain ATCC 200006 / CBS 805.95 / DAOM BR144) TaxID=431595 RepID=K3WYS7_GLOUD